MRSFTEQYNKLNPEQKQAVDAIDGPVLVVAGPGTGKTQLLSTRVANILQQTDAQSHNILCLTFTESAAHEMRERLIGIIGQAAYNVTISTYHAFGRELLERYPEYFSDVPGEQPIDDLGIHTTIQSIIDSLPYSNALKKSSYYVKDIISAISDCKRALLRPDDIREIAKDNGRFIIKTSKHTKKDLHGVVRIGKKALPKFEQLYAHTKPGDNDGYVLPGVVSLNYLWNNHLSEALEEANQSNSTRPITAWKNAWLARDSNGEFIVTGQQANQKLIALADIYELYLKTLSERGLYDYDDMILRATEGLEYNKDLRYTLQEQYSYILLDEFQDTNAAQLKLVKLLSDNPLYEGRPNVMAVGDDDQAIYAFQGADYSHMLVFTKMYRDTKVVNLTKNYRSHKDILHVAQGIAQQIEERLHHQLDDLDKVLIAEANTSQATVERHEFKSDLAQYAWVTKRVSELIHKGISASEIAIIAPKHRFLEPIMPYLSQAKIPVRYDKRENVLEDRHVMQLLRMSELVLALHDGDLSKADSLWPEVLSYDFWQIPTEEIWQLAWEASDTRQSWSKLLLKSPTMRKPALYFSALANMSHIETLETMLDNLIGVTSVTIGKQDKSYQSPFYERNFGRSNQQSDVAGFWNLLSNLTVLRQHLRDYTPKQGKQLKLADFVEFADAHIQANIKILNTSPYHESNDAVQVMTAYKAKGMEFEHVFLLACVDEVWGSKAITQTARVPLPPNLSFVRYQGASNDERLRLFFVAVTRAKTGLYMTSFATNFANKPTTRLKYLAESESSGGIISPMLPKDRQRVSQAKSELPDLEELSAYWQTRHSNPSTVKKLSNLLKPRLDRYQLAPTHLNSFTDLVFGGPEHFFINTILRFTKAPTIDGSFGNAIHETLEWIHAQQIQHGKLPTKPSITKTFETNLLAKKLSARDYKILKERGINCLEIYLPQKLKTFNPADKHEFDFKNQGVFVGDAHLSGKIDKLIINKKTKTITIVDYKTGKSFSTWKSDVKLHKYKQQLYMYKLLVEGSYAYADYTVQDAYLEFVEPDEEGNIVDLHIRFNSAQMQHIKKLLIAVWSNIKSLNFPEVSEYEQNLKGIKQFEDYLIKKLP